MLFVLIIIFSLLALLAIFKPIWFNDKFPWIWNHILIYIRNYYFKLSYKKIFIAYLRTVTAICVGYPILKLGINWSSSDSTTTVITEIGSGSYDFIVLGIVGLLTLAYIIFTFRDGHVDNAEEIMDTVKDFSNKLEDLAIKSKNNTTIQNLIPQLTVSIDKLQVKQAHKLFEALKLEIEKLPNIDYETLAFIEYKKGLCSRYIDKKRSINEFYEAYKCMIKANVYNEDIVNGKIYALIIDKQKDDSIQLAEKQKERNENNFWCWIPNIYFSENTMAEFEALPANIKGSELFMANLLNIGCEIELDKIVDLESYKYAIPDKFVFDNLPLWLYYITISLNKYLYFCGYDFLGIRASNDIIDELFNITEQYIHFETTTEVANICPDVYYIHYFIGFEKDKNAKFWIEKYKSTSYTEQHKEYHQLFYAIMLKVDKQFVEAAKVIDEYGEDELPVLFNTLRIAIFNETNDEKYLIQAFKSMADYGKIIDDQIIFHFVTPLMRNANQLKDYTCNLCFKNPLSKCIYSEIDKFYRNEKVDIQLIKENEISIPFSLIPFVSLIYDKFDTNKRALDLLRPLINTKTVDFNLTIFIELLKKKGADNVVELYNILKDIRANGCDVFDDYLSMEADLAVQCSDFSNANKVMKILYSRHPNNDNVFNSYLYTLSKNDEIDIIENLQQNALSRNIKPEHVINIFNVFLNAGFSETALQILYKATKMNNVQELNELYISVCLTTEIAQIVHKAYNQVFEGSYVCYEIDGTQTFGDVLKNSVLEDLINHLVGEEVALTINGKEKIVRVISIHNEYFKHEKEISNIIFKQQTSKRFRSFTIDDLMAGGDILANLEKMSGQTQDIKEERKELLNKYTKKKAALFQQLNMLSIAEYYDVIFGEFKIYNEPYLLYYQLVSNSNIATNDIHFVLDITSLILIHEICCKHNCHFPFKFIIPSGLKDYISSSIHKEKGLPTYFSEEIINQIQLEQDDSNTQYVIKMRMLLKWIDENCIIEIAEEKLKLQMPTYTNHSEFDAKIESLILSFRDKHIMISEDWGIGNFFNDKVRVISTESLFYIVNKEIAPQISNYLADLHFIGCNISADYITTQYFNMIQEKENTYSDCLLSIEYNKNLYINILQAGLNILSNKIIIASTKTSVTQMFTCLFKTMNQKTVRKIIDGHKYFPNQIYKEFLENSFNAAFPIIL